MALLLATGFGLGYIPIAPGTWGSFGGVVLATIQCWILLALALILGVVGVLASISIGRLAVDTFVFFQCLIGIGVAILGVIVADRAASYLGARDPQVVVIDEISGQQITLLLGGFWFGARAIPQIVGSGHPLGMESIGGANWKYLLAGFILFRVFDIWKPFPVRQAESLPGGWGIMADDWVAAVYAAVCLWGARALGL